MKDFSRYVAHARAHGDAREDTYERLAESFWEAHHYAPGGVSVEVGTRKGGSALMQLLLLEDIYPKSQPFLVTVDPYGDKPYLIGGDQAVLGLYGNNEYLYAKKLLADRASHVHFSITSLDFLLFCRAGLRLWAREEVMLKTVGFTHVFLDGDHDAKTILGEVQGFLPMLRPCGRIVIDNTPDDPQTIPGLEALAADADRVGYKMTLLKPIHDMAVIVRHG